MKSAANTKRLDGDDIAMAVLEMNCRFFQDLCKVDESMPVATVRGATVSAIRNGLIGKDADGRYVFIKFTPACEKARKDALAGMKAFANAVAGRRVHKDV